MDKGVLEAREVWDVFTMMIADIDQLWGPKTDQPNHFCNKVEILTVLDRYKLGMLEGRMFQEDWDKRQEAKGEANNPDNVESNVRLSPKDRLAARGAILSDDLFK